MIVVMRKRETWYAIGSVSDGLVRALRQQARMEKFIGEVTGALERVDSAPADPADLGNPQGKGAGGTEPNDHSV